MISVEQTAVDEIYAIHAQIPEFASSPGSTAEQFETRLAGKNHIILKADSNGSDAGYMIAYDCDGDGSFYCWMTGVVPDYRGQGVLSAMMDKLTQWATEQGYTSLTIKTRNNKREMLTYLVKEEWLFLEVQQKSNAAENRIVLEKALQR